MMGVEEQWRVRRTEMEGSSSKCQATHRSLSGGQARLGLHLAFLLFVAHAVIGGAWFQIGCRLTEASGGMKEQGRQAMRTKSDRPRGGLELQGRGGGRQHGEGSGRPCFVMEAALPASPPSFSTRIRLPSLPAQD